MRFVDDKWIFSPTDLATFVRCEHAIELRRRVSLGEMDPPEQRPSHHTELLARRGGEHEKAYVEQLKQKGKSIVEIPSFDEISREDAQRRTLDAMKAGAEIIVQALLSHGEWLGYADILERTDAPSRLGNCSYEIVDTKLAKTVHPHVILQLGIYSRLLGAMQGLSPETMHIVLGDGSRSSFRCDEFDAYLTHISNRFIREIDAGLSTEPYPVEFCSLCRWNLHCYRQWLREDHLCLVAGISRDQVKRLGPAGITTLTALGDTDPSTGIAGMAATTLDRIANQARIQLEGRREGKHKYEFLDPEERRGFQRLPEPSPGDLFFDVEADPFEDRVYLFGLAWRDEDGNEPYRPFWAHSQEEERKAFESVIDTILARRRGWPGARVYHYGSADVDALKRLMGAHGTREVELDDLLRSHAFIDLLSIVRQSIRISHPSYSLKKVETFYMERESEGVIDAGGAIVAYEDWLVTNSQATLDEIRDYNKEDCVSLIGLQQWLGKLRLECENEKGVSLPWASEISHEPTSEEIEDEQVQSDELSNRLIASLPENRQDWTDEERTPWILANLLHYHRRDAKPGWWEHFDRMTRTPEQLVEDKEAIGLLEPTGREEQIKKSVAIEFRYPPQQHKIGVGDNVRDPERLDEKGYATKAGTIHDFDDEQGTIWIKRGPSLEGAPLPRSIVPGGPIDDTVIRKALRRFAQTVVDGGLDGTPYEAGRDILLRLPPRIRNHPRGTPIQNGDLAIEDLVDIAQRLDRSALFIQGPPGSGKTYRGARIIVELIRAGKRVGVSATSHKAIHNLLAEVERQAHNGGVAFRGLKHSSSKDAYVSRLSDPLIRNTSDKAKSYPDGKAWDEADPTVLLVAGTAWCFSADRHDEAFDVLMIDEAGQMSLATALAISTAAKAVILLGDPLQLAQVSQGTHPDGCGVSALEHLLGIDPTIPPERGVFLEHTRRMHPDVCRFISAVVYDSRLESAPECSSNLLANAKFPASGLLFRPVEHAGCSQDSTEEAVEIASIAADLLSGAEVTAWNWTENRAKRRALSQGDILVVTPYNAQVREIRRTLSERGLESIRVGTVDKFQGQEAPVVFFSMATSTGEDVPRSIDFLFSRNRLNVAISRAQCIAILIASPKLLDVHCRTIEQMKLVNALCRFVEMAKEG